MIQPAALVRTRVVVHGRVQGVWFRQSCRTQALALSVYGSVRNCEDGTVEAVFEGPPAAVEAMIAWCRVGPRHASVTSVLSVDESAIGETGFRVR